MFTPPQFHCRAWLLRKSRPWLPTPCTQIAVSVPDQENPVHTQGSGWSLWSEPRLTDHYPDTARPIFYFADAFISHMGLCQIHFTTWFARLKPSRPITAVYLACSGLYAIIGWFVRCLHHMFRSSDWLYVYPVVCRHSLAYARWHCPQKWNAYTKAPDQFSKLRIGLAWEILNLINTNLRATERKMTATLD